MDHDILSDQNKAGYYLSEMKKVAKETNKKFSKILKIEESKQLTLVKPSGTVSLLASTASGIHPRYAKYYIRRVTQDKKDPLTAMMMSEKIPYTDIGEKIIFSFPIKSPENSKTKMTTKEQLDLWLVYRKIWCDGNPSQTIYYNDDTFLELQDWIWKNWDQIGGLSFFPKDDNVYENQPFEEVTKDEYSKLKSSFPKINWNNLKNFEKEDNSVLEVAIGCSGGACEI